MDAITKENPSRKNCFNHSTGRDHHLLHFFLSTELSSDVRTDLIISTVQCDGTCAFGLRFLSIKHGIFDLKSSLNFI